jgi:hypothetical protein
MTTWNLPQCIAAVFTANLILLLVGAVVSFTYHWLKDQKRDARN